MLQTSPAAFSSIEEDVHPFRHCNTNIIISFLPHYFNMWIYTQAACIHFHLNQYLRQRQQSDRKPYTYMRKKRNTRTKTGDHSGREHLQDSWKVIMQNWQGLLPGGSEEACYLVAKACIVGMFHDGHELNAVVTWRQNHKWMQLTRHSLQFLRIRAAFPNECNSLTCNPGLWTSSSLFLRLLFTHLWRVPLISTRPFGYKIFRPRTNVSRRRCLTRLCCAERVSSGHFFPHEPLRWCQEMQRLQGNTGHQSHKVMYGTAPPPLQTASMNKGTTRFWNSHTQAHTHMLFSILRNRNSRKRQLALETAEFSILENPIVHIRTAAAGGFTDNLCVCVFVRVCV